MNLNSKRIYSNSKTKTFSQKRFISLILIICTILIQFSLSHQTSDTVWQNDDYSIENLNSPFEIFSKFDLQNFTNFNNDFIKKKVLKLGIRYEESENSENLISSYIVIYSFNNVISKEKFYCGLEYYPNNDILQNSNKLKGKKFKVKKKIFSKLKIILIIFK